MGAHVRLSDMYNFINMFMNIQETRVNEGNNVVKVVEYPTKGGTRTIPANSPDIPNETTKLSSNKNRKEDLTIVVLEETNDDNEHTSSSKGVMIDELCKKNPSDFQINLL